MTTVIIQSGEGWGINTYVNTIIWQSWKYVHAITIINCIIFGNNLIFYHLIKFGSLICLSNPFDTILKSEFVCLVRFSNILIALSFLIIRLSIMRVCPSDKIRSTYTDLFCPNLQNLLI